MRKLVVATAVALIIPAAACAHVTIQPSFVEDGVETEISFQTPNERPPNETISLSVKAPPGISIDSASSPPGWNADVSGSSVTWTGGRLVDRTTTSFPVRVTAKVRAGTYSFAATQAYSDNADGEVERRPDRAPRFRAQLRRRSTRGPPSGWAIVVVLSTPRRPLLLPAALTSRGIAGQGATVAP